MKIGQFGEGFIPVIDGVARVMKAYADTLAAHGEEVYVIAPMYDTGFRGALRYEIVDFNAVQIARKLPWRIGFDRLDQHFTARMKQIQIDIAHIHGPGTAGHIGVEEAKRRNLPLVGTFHTKFYDDILRVTGVRAFAKLGSRKVAEFYERCDEVWAVSEGTGETLKSYGFKGNLRVMQNGTNRRPLNVAVVPEVRERFHIRTDVPVLLYVGQINWKKNLRRTLEACGILCKEGIDFQLVMAGQGPDETPVKSLAKSLGFEDKLNMVGHVTDVEVLDAIYSMADLFVFPSTYDNAPMVVREAAAQHTCTLTVAGSCTAEVVKDLVTGIVVEDDSEAVAQGIKTWINLPSEKRGQIEQAAYDTIPIPWDEIIEKVLARYQELIDMKRLENARKKV